ncbi:FtsX-like permease family protein [Plantactinospora sp. KLBMP9567]|uniref:FtsX-like permease family protein n=1 Tax=Plantactinospora sp. KLBMP9567 TaxID=3085900 RepID=UPI0029812490|nr:FtsX-like permease family protein [Plantactinospora sp. KLBMP9567]MDW5327025.1 FtsX-like permease family protein [Plantactinospora sp. KLBMP9567]
MAALLSQTFRARWRAWLPALGVVVLVSTLVGVSVLHFWTTTTPQMADAVEQAGTTLAEVRIAAQTIYVLTALFGAIALNVVGAATVQAERTLMAQWRLAGAVPRQTAGMAVGLVGLTALAGSIPGAILAALIGPPMVSLLNTMAGPDIASVPVTMHLAPAAVTILLTIGTCLLGAVSPARRAGRVPAIEALVATSPRPVRLTAWRWVLTVIGAITTGVIAVAALTVPATSNGMVTIALYLGLCLILTFHVAAPGLVPAIIRGFGRLLAVVDSPALQIARRSAVARSQISSATVAPLAAGLGCVGILVGTLNTFLARMRTFGVTEVNVADTWIIVTVAAVMLTGCSVAVVALTSRNREREFALLRVAGATPTMLGRVVLLEAMLYVATALILAAVATLATAMTLAWLGYQAGLPFTAQFPGVALAAFGAAAYIAIAIATALPAKKAIGANLRSSLSPE